MKAFCHTSDIVIFIVVVEEYMQYTRRSMYFFGRVVVVATLSLLSQHIAYGYVDP